MLLNELLAHREHFCCSRWPVRSCWLGNYTLICRQSWPIQWLIYHLRNSTNHKNKSTHCLLTLEEQEQRVLFCAGPEPGPGPRPPETTSSFSPVWWTWVKDRWWNLLEFCCSVKRTLGDLHTPGDRSLSEAANFLFRKLEESRTFTCQQVGRKSRTESEYPVVDLTLTVSWPRGIHCSRVADVSRLSAQLIYWTDLSMFESFTPPIIIIILNSFFLLKYSFFISTGRVCSYVFF